MGDNNDVDLARVRLDTGCDEHFHFDESHVGGRPTWFPGCPPTVDQLKCNSCRSPMLFLLQVYVPAPKPHDVGDDEYAIIDGQSTAVRCYHRILYVFCCLKSSCYRTNSNGGLKVLRCQGKDDDFIDDSVSCDLCEVCGGRRDARYGAFCCENHAQTNHSWFSYRQYELIGETEEECISMRERDTSIVKQEDEEEAKRKYEEYLRSDLLTADVGDLETRAKSEDETFSQFTKRVGLCPDQVVRFDFGGCPLWIAEPQSNINSTVPNCQLCGHRRLFECQIMPHLLNVLRRNDTQQLVGLNTTNDTTSNDGLTDFGTIAIFVCSQCCDEKRCESDDAVKYVEEFIIKQDLVK